MDARTRELITQQILFLAMALFIANGLGEAGLLWPGAVQALSLSAFITSIIRVAMPRGAQGVHHSHDRSNQPGASKPDESPRAEPRLCTVAVIDAQTKGVREIASIRFDQPFRERVESDFTHADGAKTPSVGTLISQADCERSALYAQNKERLRARTSGEILGGYLIRTTKGQELALMVLLKP